MLAETVQTTTRNDYLTAMVVWFDCGFTKIHKPIWLSTGPRTSLHLHAAFATALPLTRGNRRHAR